MALILLHTGEMFEGGIQAFARRPVSFFKKFFGEGVVVCEQFVRCKVKGCDGHYAVPFAAALIKLF